VVSGSTRKKIDVNVEDDDSIVDTCVSPFSTQMPPNVNGEEEVDDVHANCNDHDEGEFLTSYNVIYFIFTCFHNFNYIT